VRVPAGTKENQIVLDRLISGTIDEE
jgi:hypothetical protein